MATPHPIGTIHTAEYHTAGEPFRIVTDGAPETEGATVLDRRSWAQEHLDEVRAFLVNEPRGHADMYGGFVTPPDDGDGDLGVIFFHKDGFSTACGHGTIALATWAIDSGRIEPGEDRSVEMVIDVPSGRLRVVAELDERRRVNSVRFWNVDSFVTAQQLPVETDRGVLTVDVSFGGAFYGSVPLDDPALGLTPDRADLGRLIDLAGQIKARFQGHDAVTHPDPRLSGMYGVIFHRDMPPSSAEGDPPPALQQRNVTVFADGEVDRSPCGSGTSARLAVLQAQDRLDVGDVFVNEGVAGGRFVAGIEDLRNEDDRALVATWVTGSAYTTGTATFVLDERDPIGVGFQLR
ncbi:MAG: proline racemase family protein [Actinomycetota bacterium]